MSRLERQAMLAMVVALSLATAIAVAAAAPVKAAPIMVSSASVEDRAREWYWLREETLARLKAAQAKIEALGGYVRVPAEIVVRFDLTSMQAGLAVIHEPSVSMADVAAKITIVRTLELSEPRNSTGAEAIGVILEEVARLKDGCI